MGKSKNKKSKKSEVDEALDNFGGRYEMKYDENGNVTWEKVESEEELLDRLFKGANKNKSNKIPKDSDVSTSLNDTMTELFSFIDSTYKAVNNFPPEEINEAMTEFRKLDKKTQEMCVNDNIFRGILLATNAFNEIIQAIVSDVPIKALSYVDLLNELYEIEAFFRNNSNNMDHKKLN